MPERALVKKIEALTEIVSKLIIPNSNVVPVSTGDHDLLTKLDTKVDQIQTDVTAMKAQTSQSPTRGEHVEVIRVQTDHEARLRTIETFQNTLTGKMIAYSSLTGVVTGALILIVNHFWK